MTLNCIQTFIVTGSFLYWCVMRPASQRFFSCIHLRISITSCLSTFLGNLIAVKQSINKWTNISRETSSLQLQCIELRSQLLPKSEQKLSLSVTRSHVMLLNSLTLPPKQCLSLIVWSLGAELHSSFRKDRIEFGSLQGRWQDFLSGVGKILISLPAHPFPSLPSPILFFCHSPLLLNPPLPHKWWVWGPRPLNFEILFCCKWVLVQFLSHKLGLW